MVQQVYISDNQTAERYGVSRGTVWRWSKENPEFPKPVYFSKGCVRWSISELEAYEKHQAESTRI